MLEFHVEINTSASAGTVGGADGLDLPVASLGVGYEQRAWRADALADHVIEWVPDFALRPEERNLEPGRVVDKLRRAYRATFGTSRGGGVPAEILLHAICREFYGSTTIVHKVVFKTADKDTYKGFDAVHCVHSTNGGLELWLGEAKFYGDLRAALRAVGSDLEHHLRSSYIKEEYAIVGSKLDSSHPHHSELQQLLQPNQAIEKIFERLVVPLFVTYDSPATHTHQAATADYVEALLREAREAADYLSQRVATTRERQRAAGDLHAELPLQLRLFMLPMADKKHLEDQIEKRLVSWLP